MPLPRFDYLRPQSLAEACGLLDGYSGSARLLAGGTDILIAMKLRSLTPRYLISLQGISGLDAVAVRGDGISLGPMLSLAAVAASPVIREDLPALAEAAARAASPELRNAGTLGGNICLDNRCTYYNQSDIWRMSLEPCFKYRGQRCYVVKGGKQCFALASADTVPVLLALDASLRLVSTAGERLLPIGEFFTGRGDVPHALRTGEVLSEVVVPRPKAGSLSAFQKLARRNAIDFPLLDVAVSLRCDGQDCRDVRIAFSAVGPAPLRARGAEGILEGKPLTADTIMAAADQAGKEVRPLSAIGTTVSYRRQMIASLLRSTLEQLAAPPPGRSAR